MHAKSNILLGLYDIWSIPVDCKDLSTSINIWQGSADSSVREVVTVVQFEYETNAISRLLQTPVLVNFAHVRTNPFSPFSALLQLMLPGPLPIGFSTDKCFDSIKRQSNQIHKEPKVSLCIEFFETSVTFISISVLYLSKYRIYYCKQPFTFVGLGTQVFLAGTYIDSSRTSFVIFDSIMLSRGPKLPYYILTHLP